MEFVRGKFQTLEAQTTVHLGRLEKNLMKGDLIEFDGYTLKFAGSETPMPELKAGIKRGWLVLSEGAVESAPAPEATPAPAKKEMKVETVYDEERAVAEVKKTSSDVTISDKIEPTEKKFPVVVESQDDDMIAVSKVDSKSGASVTSASSAETADGGIAESQGAESVGKIKIKTASKQKTVISDGNQASSEISRLENMSRDAVASEEATVEDISTEVEEATVPTTDVEEAAQILSAVDGDVNPAQGAVTVGEDTSKVKALPVGIDWDMAPHWTKRVNTALELYRDHPEILDAIMEVESKGVVNGIKKGLGA